MSPISLGACRYAATALIVWLGAAVGAHALSCSAEFLIDETLATGARWELCWEPRLQEGIVLSDVTFTPPEGQRRRVLGEAALAQIHVPYDDDGARFHDLSDFGIGGVHLADLTSGECPGGALIAYDGKNLLCKSLRSRGMAYRASGSSSIGHELHLFSVSHVGSYNYLPTWIFHDDGTIEVAMGATGRLQRLSLEEEDEVYGWPVENGTIGISHLHNYYWRLDFDLGASATDDFVEEIDTTWDSSANTRSRSMQRFDLEAARSVTPEKQRTWRVVDSELNSRGHAKSYEIELLDVGHRDVGPAYEPFTVNDVYITRARACERFASHNPTIDCAADLSEFVDQESLLNEDVIVWVGLSFHHIPRAEDEPRMYAHWNGFKLIPRDWMPTNPLADEVPPLNTAPSLAAVPGQNSSEGDDVQLSLVAADPEDDTLTFGATGLPTGLMINASDGEIQGVLSYESAGTWPVVVSVHDGQLSDQVGFDWSVQNTNRNPQFTNPGTLDNSENEEVGVDLQVSDPDGDPLTYALDGLPPGVAINEQTGRIEGRLTFEAAGEWNVHVQITDGDLSAASSFLWRVSDLNRPPQIAALGDRINDEGDSGIEVPLAIMDPDGDPFIVQISGLPCCMVFDRDQNVLAGWMSYFSEGSYAVEVEAADVRGGSATTGFSWLVNGKQPFGAILLDGFESGSTEEYWLVGPEP